MNHWTSYSTINIEWHGASDITSGVYGYSFEWSQSIDTLPDTVLDTTSNSVTTTLSSGIWYLHIRTRDAAGNWGFSAYHIGPFKIDTSPPSASVHLDGMYGMNNWFIDPVTVSIPTEDSFSGVDYILYSLDNGPWLTYSGPFTVSGDLSHRVYYKCVDYAGNWCDEDYREFVIDTTSPDTDAIVIGDTNPDGEYLNSAIVSFRIDDNLELYSHTEFRVNYGPWQMYNGPFTVSGAGYYLIHFYSVDYAGNVESEDYVDFDVIEIGYFYDDFETPSTGYDATVWTQEAWGTGSFWWDGDSISGLTASGHGHRTLVSNEFFQPDVKAKMNLRMTNYAGWEPAVCFGWTDMIAGGEGNVHGYWNYHFLGGQNGVWMELNWPQQDWFMLYSLKNGILSELRIYEDFTQFHDYELWWTSDEVILYIDGEIYGTLTNNVPTVPLEFKMTVTAWAGNTPDEWLYVDSVEIGEAQITPRAQIHAVGDDQGRVHLFQLNGLNNPVLLWTTKLTGTLVQRILLADVDQNGRNEVLAGTNAGWLYCLDGETGNTIWSYYTPWSGFYCWPDIFATNLDTDAQLEIVTAAYCKIGVGGGVIVLEHTGGVKALHNTPITYGHNGNGPDAISLGDFNDDDIQDVACLYGNVLYSGPQPRIQVVDFSSGTANVLIDFRYGGFTGSGMTNFDLGDLNSDGNLDFVTSGWWCPVAAFNDAGNLLWSVNAPGNADKVSKFVENRNGLGDNAVVIGTGAYSNTGGLYIYFVNPATGSILSSIPLGITASDFRPWAIANLDDDPAMEVIASSNTVYTTADRMTILDGGTMQVSWFATIEFTSQFFLPYDLNGDNQAEILAPNGRYISLFSGYGSRIWDYYLGAIPYVQSVAPLLIEVPPSPPTPFLAEGWSDDFNDGNFDGWSVTRGGYSAANYYLEGMTSTWNYIEHASTAVVGSWSFDYNFYGGPDGIWQGPDGDLGIWFIANDHWHSGDTTQLQSGYFIYFHPHVNAIELWMDPGDEGYNRVLLGSWSPPNFVKSWHVDITRDSNGVFNVYLDGVNRIQATDTTFYTSSFFGFLGYNLQEMDNVVVQDTGESTIDYDGTFTLSWKMETPSGTAIDYYQLQVSDNPDFTRLLGIWCPDYGLLSQDVTLLSPATYFFRIRAFDVNGFAGEWSNVQTMIVSRDTTIPLIDSPLDLIYEEASTGNTRVWNPTDFNPEHYQIYCDGYLVESGVWTGGPLVVAVDGLQQGNYSWTAVVFDTYDNWISDTLFVTVLENEAPEVGDVNTIYEAGTIGNTVTWYPYDFTPSRFEIWFGTTCIDSGDWDGSPISCFVDGLNPGVYSFDLTVFDATGLSAIAVAAITVVDTTNPVVTITPESTTVEEGSFGTEITWIATDLYPESYILWIDESPFASGPWVGGPVIITIDGLLLGTYNYTLTFIDESGNAASTFVWVYAEDTTPPSIDGPTEIVYEAGTTGNWIYWIASEPHPLEYMISLNGEPIILGLWGGNNLQRNIDGHDPGTYYYTLTCWDVFNNVGSHEVVVIVEDTTAPIVWGSDDLVYEAGVPGHSLTWSFTDLYPKYYVILRNGSLIDSDIWTGFDITISVDLLNPGLYNFSFVAYDLYGNYAVDLVWVNVEGNTPSGTDIEVPDLDTGVTLTFEETSTPGTTEVVITETGPTPPDNFRLMGVFYNITTTANFDGIIVVAIPYDEALVNGLEKNLKLWHWRESAGWEDCTILVDEANNIIYGEVTHLSLFGVMEDNASPITSYSLSGTEGLNGWYVSDVSLMLTATDTISEIGATYYSFDKIIWHLYSSCISITDAGLTSIFFYSIDVAHNVEETNQVDFKIDQSTPDTIATLTPVTPDGLSNWYINPVDVTLSFDDATSGVYQTFYRVNESPWILYITPVTFSVDGVYLLEFWSVDCAGNQESAESISFKIDQTSPTTTHSIGDPSFSTDPTYIKTITPISLEATDSLAGLTVTEYRLDMGVWIEYTSTFNILEIGFHTIDYRSWDTAGNLEDYHSFAVFVNAVELTYIGAIEGDYSDPVVLQAELIDIATQQPVSGKIIYFTLGSQSAEATTNELGIASVSPIIGQQAGVYTVNAVFYGDTQYTLSEHSTTFIIIKERAVPEYTGTTVVPTTANEITLRATVFDANDGYFGDVTKIQVTFRIYTAPIILSSPLLVVGPVYLEQSDVDGVGVITIDIGNLPENGYIIIISIDPEDNPFYMGPSSDLVTLTIFEPTGDFVTGGGWLMGPSGEKSNFGFNVKYSKRGTPRGQSIYIFHEGDWETIVKSNAWTGMAIDGDHSFFEGKCTVQNYNTETGELLWDEGNYQFRVDVWDNDESGGIDVYQIRVLDKDGLVFHEVGFYPLGLLGGGNIAIHLEKEE
ncbi:MAG: OmpL47-type beta-barrel domain-containing protein [Candidatus Sifarchaeia archaeon]